MGLRGLVDGVMVVADVVGPKDLLGCEEVLVYVLRDPLDSAGFSS